MNSLGILIFHFYLCLEYLIQKLQMQDKNKKSGP